MFVLVLVPVFFILALLIAFDWLRRNPWMILVAAIVYYLFWYVLCPDTPPSWRH